MTTPIQEAARPGETWRWQQQARRAGLGYLAIIILGLCSELWLRGGLAGPGASGTDGTDGTAAAAALVARLGAFRLSIGFDMIMAALDVALAVIFYRMLRGAGEGLALAAMAFRLIQAALIATGLLALHGAALAALAGADPRPGLALHAAAYDLGLFFFGINGLLMAWLLCAAGAARALAGGIGAAGLVYLAGSLTRFLAPGLNAAMQPAYLVPVLAETAFMIWLLLGAPRRTPAAGPHPG